MTERHFYEAWSEWDLGLEKHIYATEGDAWNALKKAFILQDMDISWEEAFDDNLVGVDRLFVVEPSSRTNL
jgi:hypothetical protein